MLVKVKCPARITSLLRVAPRDETGYHPLEAIYQTVSLFDSLEIELGGEKNIITTNWLDSPIHTTLHKVLNFAREIYEIPPLKIHLTKRIPTEGGLGGASSDAAGLLRALEILFPSVFTHAVQLTIASAIGKNVPFFLYGGRARCTGYGDTIEQLEDVYSSWVCIVKPPTNISTSKAYKMLDENLDVLDDKTLNSFEKIMPPICHEIKENLLKEQATYAQLCGSGSAVYGTFLTKEQAQQAALIFTAKGFTETFVASKLTKQESLWISYF